MCALCVCLFIYLFICLCVCVRARARARVRVQVDVDVCVYANVMGFAHVKVVYVCINARVHKYMPALGLA